MEINYLDRLKMTQEDDINSNSNELVIVQARDLVDDTISSMSYVRPKNGVHVATVIPASFFSYNGDSIAQLSGVVYLKLQGSRRRLAVEIVGQPKATGGADKESAFAIEVKLEKNELGLGDAAVTTAANSAAVMSGFILVATVFGSAAVRLYGFGMVLEKDTHYVAVRFNDDDNDSHCMSMKCWEIS
eukprot:scaffold12912_cov143-Skeletonema_marinoi.AAC.7